MQNLRFSIHSEVDFTLFMSSGETIMVHKPILSKFKYFESKFSTNPDDTNMEIYCEYPETLNFIKEALYVYEVSCIDLNILFELIMFFNMIEEPTLCELCQIQYRIILGLSKEL